MFNKHIQTADIDLIKRLIPHREPFLLIDRVEDVIYRKSARGIKAITPDEPYFEGHFPGAPIMPGVLVIETMAQTGAVAVNIWDERIDTESLVYFLTIQQCKFRNKVVPGDVLEVFVETTRPGGRIWRFHADAKVNDKIVAEADLSAMVGV